MASDRNGQARSAGGARQAKVGRDIAAAAARAAALSMGTAPAADQTPEGAPQDAVAQIAMTDALPIPIAAAAEEWAGTAIEAAVEAAEAASGARDAMSSEMETIGETIGETMGETMAQTGAAMIAPAAAAAEQATPVATPVAETVRTTATATMERAMTTAEDFMAFGQGNIEALVRAGQIWAAGLQDIGKTVADSAQAQIEQNVSAFKALTGVKSLREAVDLQSTHARAALEKVVSDSGKLTDASMKLAEQALAPLTARMSVAAERFGRAA